MSPSRPLFFIFIFSTTYGKLQFGEICRGLDLNCTLSVAEVTTVPQPLFVLLNVYIPKMV